MELKAFIKGELNRASAFDISYFEIVDTIAESFARACGEKKRQLDTDFLKDCRNIGLFDLREEGDQIYMGVLAAVATEYPEVAHLIAASHDAQLIDPALIGVAELVACVTHIDPKSGPNTTNYEAILYTDLPLQSLDLVLVPNGKGSWLRLCPSRDSFTYLDEKKRGQRAVQVQARDLKPEAWHQSQQDLTVKHKLDTLAILHGLLHRGHALSQEFSEHRVLFKRKLNQFQLTQTRHVAMAAELAKLQAVILDLIERCEVDEPLADLDLISSAFARKSMRLGSDLLQIFAGTGYMMESGMPDCFRAIMYVCEAYNPAMADDDLALKTYLADQPMASDQAAPSSLPNWESVEQLTPEALWQSLQVQLRTAPAVWGLNQGYHRLDQIFASFGLVNLCRLLDGMDTIDPDHPSWQALVSFLNQTTVLPYQPKKNMGTSP